MGNFFERFSPRAVQTERGPYETESFPDFRFREFTLSPRQEGLEMHVGVARSPEGEGDSKTSVILAESTEREHVAVRGLFVDGKPVDLPSEHQEGDWFFRESADTSGGVFVSQRKGGGLVFCDLLGREYAVPKEILEQLSELTPRDQWKVGPDGGLYLRHSGDKEGEYVISKIDANGKMVPAGGRVHDNESWEVAPNGQIDFWPKGRPRPGRRITELGIVVSVDERGDNVVFCVASKELGTEKRMNVKRDKGTQSIQLFYGNAFLVTSDTPGKMKPENLEKIQGFRSRVSGDPQADPSLFQFVTLYKRPEGEKVVSWKSGPLETGVFLVETVDVDGTRWLTATDDKEVERVKIPKGTETWAVDRGAVEFVVCNKGARGTNVRAERWVPLSVGKGLEVASGGERKEAA